MNRKLEFVGFAGTTSLIFTVCLLSFGCICNRSKEVIQPSVQTVSSGWGDVMIPEFRMTPGDDIRNFITSTIDSVLPSQSGKIVTWLADGSHTNAIEGVIWGSTLADGIRTICETNGLLCLVLTDAVLIFDEPIQEQEQVFFCIGNLMTEKSGHAIRRVDVKFHPKGNEWIEGCTSVSTNGEFISWVSIKAWRSIGFYGDFRLERIGGECFLDEFNPISEIQLMVDDYPPYTLCCDQAGAAVTTFKIHLAFINGSWKKLDNASAENRGGKR